MKNRMFHLKPLLHACLAGCGLLGSLNALAHETHDTLSYKSAAVPVSHGGLTGNFDMTSNYMFRGISNSNNLPAVQGGWTYTFGGTGLYFNLWGSNVNFVDPQGNLATVEFDTIMG